MVPITASFISEAPLHPKAAELLALLFDKGWSDPAKIHNSSREAGRLIQEAKESFAGAFGLRTDEIYFLGEPPLGFHLGINGLLSESSTLYYSPTDRAPVHAIVDDRRNRALQVSAHEPVNSERSDLLVFQSTNPETGIQKELPQNFLGNIFVDNTSYGLSAALPDRWSSAMWQSRSWDGPGGLGVFALKTGMGWRNPLPHNDASKVPQSFSIPLALASAVALEAFRSEAQSSKEIISHFKKSLVQFLINEVGGVIAADDGRESSPYLLSLIFEGIDSERLVHALSERGLDVDSGSACISANLQPSHVLAAMGLPTTGNIRITLHHQTTEEDLDLLMHNLKELVIRQRSEN